MRLLVNADDLGLSRRVNDAIFQLMSAGRIRSATLIPNGLPVAAPGKLCPILGGDGPPATRFGASAMNYCVARPEPRCGQPGQQQGRRMPFRILSRPTMMRRFRVSSFLADVTQQIHSLRANGVRPAHTPVTTGSDSIALRKSAGILWTVPSAIIGSSRCFREGPATGRTFGADAAIDSRNEPGTGSELRTMAFRCGDRISLFSAFLSVIRNLTDSLRRCRWTARLCACQSGFGVETWRYDNQKAEQIEISPKAGPHHVRSLQQRSGRTNCGLGRSPEYHHVRGDLAIGRAGAGDLRERALALRGLGALADAPARCCRARTTGTPGAQPSV